MEAWRVATSQQSPALQGLVAGWCLSHPQPILNIQKVSKGQLRSALKNLRLRHGKQEPFVWKHAETTTVFGGLCFHNLPEFLHSNYLRSPPGQGSLRSLEIDHLS